MRVICVITNPGIGGTFLSWTIEYLSGHKKAYNVVSNRYDNMSDSIKVGKVNFHNYKPNQCFMHEDMFECVQKKYNLISKEIGSDFGVLYFHPISKTVDFLNNNNQEVIFMKLPSMYILYQSLITERATGNSREKKMEKYFHNSLHQWDSQEIYDKRENIALNINPFDYDRYADTGKFINNAYRIMSPDVWFNLDNSIFDILNYLDIKIDKQRYGNWLNVYNEWKKLHSTRVLWCWYFDEIIEAILNGYDMDLKRFDLDLFQEAAIQHVLIFKYNLNFKTYKLYKFKNTKQLHNLLESNVHNLIDSELYSNDNQT